MSLRSARPIKDCILSCNHIASEKVIVMGYYGIDEYGDS